MIDRSYPASLHKNIRWALSTPTHVEFKLQIQESGNQPHLLSLLCLCISETSFIEETNVRTPETPSPHFSFPMRQTYGVFQIKYCSHRSLCHFHADLPLDLFHKLSGKQEQCQPVLVPSIPKALQNKIHTSWYLLAFGRKLLTIKEKLKIHQGPSGDLVITPCLSTPRAWGGLCLPSSGYPPSSLQADGKGQVRTPLFFKRQNTVQLLKKE